MLCQHHPEFLYKATLIRQTLWRFVPNRHNFGKIGNIHNVYWADIDYDLLHFSLAFPLGVPDNIAYFVILFPD